MAEAEPLAGFSPATRAWFAGAFAGPTTAQTGAWAAVRGGDHALVVAPTGSGKTLAAFLWALDGLLAPGRSSSGALVAAEPPRLDEQLERSPRDQALEAALRRCQVLYVSPLKALASDVELNLRSPLVGIRQAATRLGLAVPEVTVGIRTGDTPPAERRAFATKPPDILITTPESLYLVLTSAARAGLSGVRTVILDEIHAVAGTKRGAHLALSLERLDALLPAPAQRIGLSATVRPVEAVAAFLGGGRAPGDGGRRVVVVQPASTKEIVVDVVVPVPDLSDLAAAPAPAGPGRDGAGLAPLAPGEADLSGAAAGAKARPSIWPHVEERVVDLVVGHRSTLVFTNSRRGAERLTARMNEVWAARRGEDVPDPGTLQPAAAPAQSGTSVGIDTGDAARILARAHHGSMSRAERTRTETELKAGRLPAVVATSSLELGIDMGAIDLVVQVGVPPSVASGLQRVGRAGHQVGAVSRGVVFPTFRGDLVPAAVIAGRMRRGEIETMTVLTNPLDVLAQQIVAMVAVEDWTVTELAAVVRRAAPFAGLGDATLRAVLDMLAGRYPSEEFGELRARIVWDRATDLLTARPGALRLAVTSGGTIPDRGLYGVFLASGATGTSGGSGAVAAGGADVPADDVRTGGRLRGGKRVGELDEEMVYESRVGDTFTLGSSSWRIEDITLDRVLVTPAPGVPGRLPFWKGDAPGRPAELGRAMGAWVRELGDATPAAARADVERAGLDPWAADNLLAYLGEQREATGQVPDDRTIVVERFRDEIGDWRIVLHSPYGARVHAPWALVIAARMRERYGVDAAAMSADDGIVLRLPDMLAGGDPGSWSDDAGPEVEASDLLIDSAEVAASVRAELGGSTMFGARFREAAARALLLPRRRPDRRQPLWQQRQRSAQLLSVASQYPDFPILLEAVRECLQDDFDVAALEGLMADVTARRIRLVEVTTQSPSPFAQSLLFGYTAQFLYDGDAPLAERRAAALTLDPTLLAELLGQGGASQLADLLDPVAVLRTEAELAGLAPERQARHLEDLPDVVRRHGPLTTSDAAARTREEARDAVGGWLAELEASRRVIRVRIAGVGRDAAGDRTEQWAAVEDAGRLRDALGVALPVGVPEAFTEVLPDPLGDLARRHARTHGPFAAAAVAARFGIGIAVATDVLRRLEAAGVLASGRLRPEVLGGTGEEFCDTEVLRTLRRRSLAALRAEVEPVDQRALGVFLPRWQGVGRLRGVGGLARAIEQLAGVAIPASALETHVLPARVTDYSPAMLDELTAAGDVLWAGHWALAGRDGMISLHPAATADLTLTTPIALAPDLAGGLAGGPAGGLAGAGAIDTPVHRAILAALAGGGAYFLGGLAVRVNALLAEWAAVADVAEGRADAAVPAGVGQGDLAAAVWDLVWAGHITNDGLTPLRARLGSNGGGARGAAHRTRPPAPRARPMLRGARLGLRGGLSRPPTSLGQEAGGRWSLLPGLEPDPTVRAHALAAQLLDRHGIVTRAIAPAEGVAGQFGAIYRVLAALEQAGSVRRGYFVEHLGGSQFALPGAVDQIRADAKDAAGPAADGDPPARVPSDAGAPAGLNAGDGTAGAVLLAATDPANPFGAALAWPAPQPAPDAGPALPGAGDPARHRPGRKAGAVVVIVGGALVLYLERGGRTLLSFGDGEVPLAAAADLLARTARTGRLGRLNVQRGDGAELLGGESLRSPLGRALTGAGFAPTPRGLRLRGQA